ncbi:PT domain-containing protein [Candidatus Protochlamydia amoebophila]|uniref:Uncharacterized protein n=1 Tax=Protochlamydia amoebophila (strain UWE25) TaxID=264201 RepID=Q6MAF3_PARUW|nr:PT domain-containing protein [Candidatus Protochlamydia amoebophila]CAF24446.1 unnamed protein product [Candidatus Protochlamydia amoebophila UWE25]
MQKLFDLFEHRSFKEQLILWLLSLVLLPLIWTTFISYELSKKLILDQSTNQPINQSTNQPINQSTNQPINQSTNQPII